MFRKLIVISLVFTLFLGTASCASFKSQVADLDNFTFWFRYQAEEVGSLENTNGQYIVLTTDEHFVMIVADIIRGDPQQLAFTIPVVIASKQFLGFNYGEGTIATPEQTRTATLLEGQPLVAWFYRLPKGEWPLRLVFANGTIVNITSNK